MTALGVLALSIGLLLVGTLAGFLLARSTGRAARSRPSGPTVAELLQRLVRSSRDGVVVLNRFGDVVLHNHRAEELGVVRDNRPDPRVRTAAEEHSANTEVTGSPALGGDAEHGDVAGEAPVTLDLSPSEQSRRGRGPTAVSATLRSLGDGYTVVDVVDESEAVRLEATRRDFVANVSHELKTPVGALALLAETIVDAADDPDEVRRFSRKILHESNRLSTLVSELIALSRLQGGEKPPELVMVDVDEVVDEALSRSSLAAESEGIEIDTDERSGLVVEGDRTLLVTALSNLLDNAIAYSQPGSPVSISRRLRVGEHDHEDGHPGGQVEIAVTDRGAGIPLDQQQRVFERFYRVDPARSRVTGGTGLGLAIVKHVAANHGGEVKLWSRPGTGSTLTLCLPRRGADASTAVTPTGDEEHAGDGDVDAAAATASMQEAQQRARTVEPGGVR